ncbi:uncharacterized protein DUF4157 [Paraburkholderia unamae]|uniref:Uncharacterized protein DUF4157 n=2 Tax=Paraburkholderia unamae TaxID=219649 RepID=A0ABX5KIF6_9BURK|nr:uncharacterized protein DUF4157 [Paraburkholderia unamae]
MFALPSQRPAPKSAAPASMRAPPEPIARAARKAPAHGQHDAGPQAARAVPKSSGFPLPATARAFFEPRFGFDLSRVRIHADEDAARSAQAHGAAAYALGQHIVFGAGRYAPNTTSGRQLLAHELSHTIQQRDAGDAALEARAGLRRSTREEERDAQTAAQSALAGHHFGVMRQSPRSPLALACSNADPAAAKLHDTEEFGNAAYQFAKHNSSLGESVLAKIRSGIVKLTWQSGGYEVAYSFFDFYSSFGNSVRQMSADEESKAKLADRIAETDTTLGFTTTTLRSEVLGWDDTRIAMLLLHEFTHTGHIAASSSAVGSGAYQEGQSYGVEYFYAELAGDSTRTTKIQGIVSAGEVLSYQKAADLGRFQEDFKVAYALMTALRDVVKKGSSPLLPFPEITSAAAQLLQQEVLRRFQRPDADLAKYIAYVKANLASFKLPPI